MLRESTKFSSEAIDLHDMTAGIGAGTQVAHARECAAFAEAVVSRDPARIAPARATLRRVLGEAGAADAAAVAAAFHGFTRIADAIGIPYKTAASGGDVPDIREAAGINNFFRVRADIAAGR